MVPIEGKYILDTRPLTEFKVLTPVEVEAKSVMETSATVVYPACRLVQQVFWRIIDNNNVLYGQSYTPPGFEEGKHADHRGHIEWEWVASLRDDLTATARMINLHTNAIFGRRHSETDVRGIVLAVYPVSLSKVRDAGTWKVTEDFDWRKHFMQLSVTAKDHKDINYKTISSLIIHPEAAGRVLDNKGQEIENSHIHFEMATEADSFYVGKSRNNALVLCIAGQIATAWMESQLGLSSQR